MTGPEARPEGAPTSTDARRGLRGHGGGGHGGGGHGGGGYWAPLAALVGVGLAVAVALVSGARPGAFVLAGVLAAAAGIRLLAPGDGPPGVAVRSRTVDVTLLGSGAFVIAVLAGTASGI